MALRDARMDHATASGNTLAERLLRKASQEWDLAKLARQDKDMTASTTHTSRAKEYEQMARNCA